MSSKTRIKRSLLGQALEEAPPSRKGFVAPVAAELCLLGEA